MTYWQLPYPENTITSPFGWRNDPITGARKYHTGTDFGQAQGTPIYAVADGTVARKGRNMNTTSGWGEWVWITAYDGRHYGIAHMREQSPLPVGAKVVRGKTIVGYVGKTGAATGPHLHLSISTGTISQAVNLVRDYLVDPVPYIKARLEPSLQPNQRQVGAYESRLRSEPTTTASYVAAENLKPGAVITPQGWVTGEKVSQNNVTTDVWYKYKDKFAWAGGFTNASTTGLDDLNTSVVEYVLGLLAEAKAKSDDASKASAEASALVAESIGLLKDLEP